MRVTQFVYIMQTQAGYAEAEHYKPDDSDEACLSSHKPWTPWYKHSSDPRPHYCNKEVIG